MDPARLRRTPGYEALATPMKRFTPITNRLTPELANNTRDLVRALREDYPHLLITLDQDAVAWWSKHHSRPRIGALGLWTIIVGPVLLWPAIFTAFGPPRSPLDVLIAHLG